MVDTINTLYEPSEQAHRTLTIEVLLTRIMDSTINAVICTFKDRVTELERRKIILGEQFAGQATSKREYAEKPEPILTFHSNPWRIGETAHVTPRRTVLKLTFADRIQYDRSEDAKTAEISLPINVL